MAMLYAYVICGACLTRHQQRLFSAGFPFPAFPFETMVFPYKPASGRLFLLLLIVATAMGPMALNIFLPSMPGIQAVFSADYGTVQLTLTLYLLALGMAQIAYGPISDRIGRRPALLSGMGLYVLGGLLCAAAWTIEVLILGRMLQAIGGCAGLVIPRAVVRDRYDREDAAMMIGRISMVMSLVPMISPAMGGLFDQLAGWRTSFVVCTLFGLAAFGLILLYLPETLQREPGTAEGGPPARWTPGSFISDHWSLLRNPAFLGYTMQTACSSAIFFSFLSGAAFVVVTVMGYPPVVYGVCFMLVSIGFMSGNFTTSRMARRVGNDRMMAFAALLALLGSCLVGLGAWISATNPVLLFLPMMMVAFSNGIAMPNGMAGAVSVNPRLAGTGSGIVGCITMVVGAIASQIVGHWQDMHPSAWPMVATMILFGLGAAIACWLSASARASMKG